MRTDGGHVNGPEAATAARHEFVSLVEVGPQRRRSFRSRAGMQHISAELAEVLRRPLRGLPRCSTRG